MLHFSVLWTLKCIDDKGRVKKDMELESISFQPVVPDVDYFVFWALERCFFSCLNWYLVHHLFVCLHTDLWSECTSLLLEREGGVELLCIVAADQWEARRHGLDLHSHSHRLVVIVTASHSHSKQAAEVKVCSLGPNFCHNLHNCRHRQLLADTNSVIMKLWS